jgi:hypothetical protein
MRLGSNKTVNDGMTQSPYITGGSTILSVTGRCRYGAVMDPPWDQRHIGAVPFCSVQKQFTKN